VARELHIHQLSGTEKGRELTVREFPLRIGRSENCQLRFDPQDDTKVSALHAEIRLSPDGTFELFDLDSRNGTFLNGSRVASTSQLPERSLLEIGKEGPRIDVIIREGGSGVSFGDVRRKTGNYSRPDAVRPMVATDDSMPAFVDPVPPRGAAISDRLKAKPKATLFIVVAVVAAILLGALVYIA
jgi:pSer/pThr/pTyr-binding forkhead associated (FHA) protein